MSEEARITLSHPAIVKSFEKFLNMKDKIRNEIDSLEVGVKTEISKDMYDYLMEYGRYCEKGFVKLTVDDSDLNFDRYYCRIYDNRINDWEDVKDDGLIENLIDEIIKESTNIKRYINIIDGSYFVSADQYRCKNVTVSDHYIDDCKFYDKFHEGDACYYSCQSHHTRQLSEQLSDILGYYCMVLIRDQSIAHFLPEKVL